MKLTKKDIEPVKEEVQNKAFSTGYMSIVEKVSSKSLQKSHTKFLVPLRRLVGLIYEEEHTQLESYYRS